MGKGIFIKRWAFIVTLFFGFTVFILCTFNYNFASAQSNVNISTIIKLQKYLTNQTQLTTEDFSICDTDGNDVLNVYDLCLLKQSLIKNIKDQTITTSSATTTFVSETTSTTTFSSFTPPDMFDLIEEYDQGMSEEEYDGMITTAELFGLEAFKIVYSEEIIEYSLILPDFGTAMLQDLYGYWFLQICPIEDIKEINPDYDTLDFELFIWRPVVEEDEGITISTYNNLRITTCLDTDYTNYWCIIPCTLDEETGELVENLTFLYPITE